MLAILFAWLYISFLCWTWGVLFLQLIKQVTGREMNVPHFSIVCLTGLSAITVIAGLLSLFIPLGEWWAQFLFIIPALLIFFIKNIPYFFSSLKKEFSWLHISSLVLLSSLLVLILVMGSWIIVHPDTLGYHAQTIQWIEKYKAVPGLVHLHVRLGYQGLWFVDCALFDFSFTGSRGLNFLNSTVLLWFLIFIVNRIDQHFFKEGKKVVGLLWTGLLSVSLWSYTQVRLTATSASPDFIATIFVLAIIYILFEKDSLIHSGDWLLAGLLSIVAVTIKLSVAPILVVTLAASLYLLISKKYKSFLVIFIIAVLACTAFITRNIITSGYVVFPSTAVDIANVDWKYGTRLTVQEKNYITAYAKKPGVSSKDEIDQVNKMSIAEWLPGWWKNRSLADKTIMIFLVVTFIASLVFYKKIFYTSFIRLLSIATLLTGIIFWLINAPDPRFGFGFILGFIAIVAYLLLKDSDLSISRKIPVAIPVLFSAIIVSYTVYRVVNFFRPAQLISPPGIERSEYTSFDCRGIKINSPVNGEFGEIPVPVTDLNCDELVPRGNKIKDGFRAN